jgi:1-acyl-sn-glycerol-3-phosphate acyltransferase
VKGRPLQYLVGKNKRIMVSSCSITPILHHSINREHPSRLLYSLKKIRIVKTLKLIYLNTTFYVSFFLFSAVSIPLLTLLVVFLSLFLSRRRTMKRFRRAISWYGTVIIRVLPFPLVRIWYKDYARDDETSPYIFVCNHRASTDAFLMACLPYECIQVVNIWPFRLPVLGIFARWAGYLSVREMPFEEFCRKAVEFLEQGVSVIAFPEGTRSGDKRMGQFHGSIFRVALQAKCPIAPLCITGNENVLPRGSLLLRPGTIKVHKLRALKWEKYKDMNAFKLKNRVRDIIARELAVMDGVV